MTGGEGLQSMAIEREADLDAESVIELQQILSVTHSQVSHTGNNEEQPQCQLDCQLDDQHLHLEQEPQMIQDTKVLLASSTDTLSRLVPHQTSKASFESVEIDMAANLSVGVVTRVSLPVRISSDDVVESAVDPFQLYQQQHHHHLQDQQLRHMQEGHTIEDATHKHHLATKKLSSGEQSLQQQPNSGVGGKTVETGFNERILTGSSLLSTDISGNGVENLSEPCEQHPQEQQHGSIQDQQFNDKPDHKPEQSERPNAPPKHLWRLKPTPHQQRASVGRGLDIGSNVGIVMGNSVASTGTSDSLMEKTALTQEPAQESFQQQLDKVMAQGTQLGDKVWGLLVQTDDNNRSFGLNASAEEYIYSPSLSMSADSSSPAKTPPSCGSLIASEDISIKTNSGLNSGAAEFVPFGMFSGFHWQSKAPPSNESLPKSEDLNLPTNLKSGLNSGAEEFVPLSVSVGSSSLSKASSSNGRDSRKNWTHSQLNPFAEGFNPPSMCNMTGSFAVLGQSGREYMPWSCVEYMPWSCVASKERDQYQIAKAHEEDCIRRTIFVSNIPHQVREEYLARFFEDNVGHVVDCRIWGDSKFPLSKGFLEFKEEAHAAAALRFAQSMSSWNPICFSWSNTAIVPVNPGFLPQSANEMERCGRTIYCKNIDRTLSEAQVKHLFQFFCGEIAHLRLLWNWDHSTQIAFVEFVTAESAARARRISGTLFGSLPIRVTPSKTPVRIPSFCV